MHGESKDSLKRPEWVPDGAVDGFTTSVMPGVREVVNLASSAHTAPVKRRVLNLSDYVDGVLRGDRTLLARAITLVESNNETHAAMAANIIHALQPHAGKALRVGITGVPGAGKSTFIEALGTWLCQQGKKVAVLAVDPSSSRSGGSILGDKTRMERLSREPNAFIRPSPSGCTLGGVARKSRETLLLCEAAGFDVVLVETVGVGQSEVTVRSMVDFFLLIALAGAGDELQGFKKGVVELADAILVNKADGENLPRALSARAEYERVIHYLKPATEGWTTPALTCSALTGEGIPQVWATVENFARSQTENGQFEKRRRSQNVEWMHALVEEELRRRFLKDARIATLLSSLESDVAKGDIPATEAVTKLFESSQS